MEAFSLLSVVLALALAHALPPRLLLALLCINKQPDNTISNQTTQWDFGGL